MTGVPFAVFGGELVEPGNRTFDTAGTFSFTIPDFNTLLIELYGAGGSGAGMTDIYFNGTTNVTHNGTSATASGDTTIASLGLTAGAGGPGLAGSTSAGGAAGAGGVASGGDTNTTGSAGVDGRFNGSGNSPGPFTATGGAAANTGPGTGGDGGPAAATGKTTDLSAHFASTSGGGAGGGGAYCAKTFTPSDIAPTTVISDIVIGSVGAVGTSPFDSAYDGKPGVLGKIVISWE